MNREIFWNIIEEAKGKSNGESERLTENLNEKLSTLSVEDLLHFQFIYEIYEIAIISAPSNLIWTAQFLINKGLYTNTYNFAGWLIAQGKKTYLDALLNADTLVNTHTPEKECEYTELRLLGGKLYRQETGLKIKAFQKIESDFWKKPKSKVEQTEIKSEIILNNMKRDRNWKISDLQNILPNMYEKLIK
ncbi:DUF4240 domain-containing protein [Lacinutrix sp. MEBiC02595]